jgi:hypothetical protein
MMTGSADLEDREGGFGGSALDGIIIREILPHNATDLRIDCTPRTLDEHRPHDNRASDSGDKASKVCSIRSSPLRPAFANSTIFATTIAVALSLCTNRLGGLVHVADQVAGEWLKVGKITHRLSSYDRRERDLSLCRRRPGKRLAADTLTVSAVFRNVE